MAFDKLRIRFRKISQFRLVSHLDLMRCFERILRRANLPFRMSEGFHPMPKMSFALSLPLGMEGWNEVVELELTEALEPDQVLHQLRLQAPRGLDFQSVRRIDLKTTARPKRVRYHIAIPEIHQFELQESIRVFLESDAVWIPRYRPRPRQVNVRPYIHDLRCDSNRLELDLWVSQEGSVRGDELLRALNLGSLLDEGEYLVRADLSLQDEMSPEELAQTPELPTAETRASFEKPLEGNTQPELEPASTASEWGASPNGPEVE